MAKVLGPALHRSAAGRASLAASGRGPADALGPTRLPGRPSSHPPPAQVRSELSTAPRRHWHAARRPDIERVRWGPKVSEIAILPCTYSVRARAGHQWDHVRATDLRPRVTTTGVEDRQSAGRCR